MFKPTESTSNAQLRSNGAFLSSISLLFAKFPHASTHFTFVRGWCLFGDCPQSYRLLMQSLATQDVVFEQVMDNAGDIKSMTLREMIRQKLVPESHLEMLKSLVGKDLKRDLDINASDEAAVASMHIDARFLSSQLHPLRPLLNPRDLIGYVDTRQLDTGTVANSSAVPWIGLHTSSAALYADTKVVTLPDGVESAAALELNDDASLAFRRAASRVLYTAATNCWGRSRHLPVSISSMALPPLSSGRGAQPSALPLEFHTTRLVDPGKILITSAFGLGNDHNEQMLLKPPNNWTKLRLMSAIQNRLMTLRASYFESWDLLEHEDQRIMRIERVETRNSYQIGTELFASTQRVCAARSHALAICPHLDELVEKSRVASTNPHLFLPHTVNGLNRLFEDNWRPAFLHPVQILTFVLVTVEVAHKDYIGHTSVRHVDFAQRSGYKYMVLPFALIRAHGPHPMYRQFIFGDLCEIWDTRFLPINWSCDISVCAHLLPLNRLAGKFTPALLRDNKQQQDNGLPSDYPSHLDRLSQSHGMMVLRHQ